MAGWYAPSKEDEQGLFLAGEQVEAGQYREVGGRGREVLLDSGDTLPASLDGRVACYFRISDTWGQISVRSRQEMAAR